MMRKFGKRSSLAALLATAMLLLAVSLGLLPVNLYLVRGFIAEALSEMVGLELVVSGQLRVRLGRQAGVDVGQLTVINPAASSDSLLVIENLHIGADLLALLQGRVQLRTLTASSSLVDYCALAEVDFPAGKSAATELPPLSFAQLNLDHIQMRCHGEQPAVPYWPSSLSLQASAKQGRPLSVAVKATLEQYNFELVATADTLDSLLQATEQFPLTAELTLRSSSTTLARLRASGSVHEQNRLNAELEASIADAAQLVDLFELGIEDLRGIQKLQLTGNIIASPQQLELQQAQLVIEDLAVQGQASLNLEVACPVLNTNFLSSQIDLNFFDRFLNEETTIGGDAGAIALATRSCGISVQEHIQSGQATVTMKEVELLYQEKVLPLRIGVISAELGYSQRGRLELDGLSEGLPLQITADVGSLTEILGESAWPLELHIKSLDNHFSVTGQATSRGGHGGISGLLNISVPRIGSLASWSNISAQNTLGLTTTAAFDVSESGMKLDDLKLSLGQTELAGSVLHAVVAGESVVKLDLHGPLLDLQQLDSFNTASADGPAVDTPPSPDTANLADITWLEDYLRLPDVSFKLNLHEVKGVSHVIKKLNMVGQIQDRRINNAQLEMLYDGVEIAGYLDVDLQRRPWQLSYEVIAQNIDIGHLLVRFDLVEDVTARAERLQVVLGTQGVSLADLVGNLSFQAQIEKLSWLPRSLPNQADQFLDISRLQISALPKEPSRWTGEATFQKVPLQFLLHAPPVSVLLDDAADLPLHFALRAGSEGLLVDAVVKARNDDALVVQLDISGDLLDNPDSDLQASQAPLEGVRLRSLISLAPGHLEFQSLDVERGSSRILGEALIERREQETRFDLSFNSPFLETEDLVAPLARLKPLSEEEPASTEGFITMLRREFNALTEHNTFNVQVEIEQLQSRGQAFGHAAAKLAMDSKGIRLQPLTIGLPDGKIEASYLASRIADDVQVSLQLDIDNLEYGGLLRLLNADSEATGTIYLEADVSSQAPSWDQLSAGLEGSADLAMFPNDVEAGFLDLWASNLVLALLPIDSGGRKKMNCMVSRVTIEEGVLKSKNSFLDSTDIIVRVRGEIDLDARQLDLLAVPQAKIERFLSASTPIEVKGPYDSFTVAASPGGFLVTMARWYYGLIYVPWKWITGERFPADGIETCYKAMDWKLPQ